MFKNFTLYLFMLICFFVISCTKKPVGENRAPKAHAGTAKSITLPIDTVTLSGSGLDSDGTVTSYLWSQVSGPAATVIVNPGSPSTLIRNSTPGRYVFQLAVTDNQGATGTDTTSVVINPAVVKTLSIEPSGNPYEYEIVYDNGKDLTAKGEPDIPLEAWTKAGSPLTVREVLRFDFSSIPANATVMSANLSLYSYPPPVPNGPQTQANFGSDNSILVQQVISNWAPASLSWFNQPQTSTSNQVIVPSTTQPMLDVTIDVTNMVGSMVKNSANYGFFLKLQNEQIYTSRIFVSSFNTTYTTKHPKLVIQYK